MLVGEPKIFDLQRHIVHFAQGWTLLSRLRDVFLHDGRALRSGGHGHDLWARDDTAISAGASVFLVYSGIAGFGGTDSGNAGGRRLLPLDTRGLRRLLGISCRLVELVRVVFAGRRIRRSVHGLSGLLLSQLEDDVVGALPRLGDADRRPDVGQRTRYSDGGTGRDCAGDFYFSAG